MTGTTKAVLEFAREARLCHDKCGKVHLRLLIFHRQNSIKPNEVTAAFETLSVPVHLIDERRRFDHAVIPQLQAIVNGVQPEIIWSNSVKSHFLVRLAALYRYSKWVAFHHGYTRTDLKMRAYNQLDRWSLPRAHRVLTVCRQFAAELVRHGVESSRIRVQHMPVRPFSPPNPVVCDKLRSQIGVAPGARIILAIGRLSHEKDHANLIRAFALLRQRAVNQSLYLVLVGDGPERNRLEGMCRSNALGKSVIFVGQQADVNRFYAIAHIFALPSYTEGSPNVLLEAMAARIPIVSTNVGGVPELATSGQDALLVNRSDPGALAAALMRLLEDHELRDRLTSSACKVVSQHTPDTYFRSVLSVFEEASGNRVSPQEQQC